MHTMLLGAMQFNKEDLGALVYITHRDKNIYLGNEQKFELSDSGKTIYIVQYDKNKEIGRKGFRVSSCLFFTEYYD